MHRRIRSGLRVESARVEGGAVERSSQTGERYGGLTSHGGAKARTPRGPGASYENSRFGLECLRIDSRTPGVPASAGSVCLPVLPDPKCRAELYMMPIEIAVPVGDKQMTGRTTRLELRAREEIVDRNSWVMP